MEKGGGREGECPDLRTRGLKVPSNRNQLDDISSEFPMTIKTSFS